MSGPRSSRLTDRPGVLTKLRQRGGSEEAGRFTRINSSHVCAAAATVSWMRSACPAKSGSKVHNTIPAWIAVHIVTQITQLCNHRQREILIGIEASHSGGLVLADLLFHLSGVGSREVPRVHKILCSQGGIRGQYCLFADTESPRLFQQPNGNSRAHDTRLPAANVWARVNARVRVAEVLHGPL